MMNNGEEQQRYESLTEREREILTCLSSGLSDQQIAAELFLSANTIRWYNRQIFSKLGVGSRTQAIARARELSILETRVISASPPATRQPLPVQTTLFIGRSREIAEVKNLLRASRLLTLTGVGGTGKTRLALAVASAVTGDFVDGVCFVDLAPVTDPASVSKTIAAALGIFEKPNRPVVDVLKQVIAEREMLLLIDNFEHVTEAAQVISALVASCPNLKILITSREPLRLSGEQEYAIPPLSLPSVDVTSMQAVIESEAGALFVQRVKMVMPRFAFSESHASVVAQICARLDGLPLAIELAAARCKHLTPQMLLARLESRLNVLADGARDAPMRQRTLRATLEWSYNLLDEVEKTLFMRLAVFHGGCSLEAIESVCGSDLPQGVLEVLASLVDKSLIQQNETVDEPRFVMLETTHEFARERFEASQEAHTIRSQYAAYFVELAERAEPELRLAQQKRWFRLLEIERENVRAVLRWSLSERETTCGVRLAGALCWYWYVYGYHVEGLQWTQQLLLRIDDSPEQYHAKFLIGAVMMIRMGDPDIATPLLLRALGVANQSGDTYHAAMACVRLGYITMGEPEAEARVQEGLALLRDLDHKPGIAHALTIVGELARFSGDDERARRAYEECAVIFREIGDTRGILITFLNLTFVARRQGDIQYAIESAHKALRLACDLELRSEIAECLIALAGTLGVTGQPHLAACLFGTADSVIKRLGAFFDASDKPEFERMVAEVRAQLDDSTFRAAWRQGEQLTLEQAVERALKQSS